MTPRHAPDCVAALCDQLSTREIADLQSIGATLPVLGASEEGRGIRRLNRLAQAKALIRQWSNERPDTTPNLKRKA